MIYKYLSSILLITMLFCSTAVAQKTPRQYVAYKTENSLQIDGVAAEKEWANAPWSELFTDIEGVKTPKYNTRLKMLWDTTYMYYYVEMQESHVWGNLRQRDTVIFHNNDFEIFWDPDGDTHNYYEFEINALNTMWDLILTKPYREANATIDSWDIQGIKSAVKINGTLNNPNDIDEGWQLELAIPWAAFRTSFGQNNVPVNKFWRINFSRVNWNFELDNGLYSRKKDAKGQYLPEYNWVWSPQGVINMHEPEKWGYVYFSDKKPEDNVRFEIPKEEQIRWHLYSLYRQMKSNKNSQINAISDLQNSTLIYNNVNYIPILERHRNGWNIFITIKNKTYLIREDGRYTIM